MSWNSAFMSALPSAVDNGQEVDGVRALSHSEREALSILSGILNRSAQFIIQRIWNLTQRAAPIEKAPVQHLEPRDAYACGYFDGLRAAVEESTLAVEFLKRAHAVKPQPETNAEKSANV